MSANEVSKSFTLLLVVLGINTLRYGTYLLEGTTGIYNWTLFILNLLTVVYIVILKTKKNETEIESSNS